MKFVNTVLKQKEFLIMLTLYENIEYERGLTSRDLVFELIDNKTLWFKVGQVREDKQFETSLKGDLSRLRKSGYLNKTAARRYIKSENFEKGFIQVISNLYEDLDINIDFQEDGLNLAIDKENLIKKADDGDILYNWATYDDTKKLIMLTEEQIMKLVKLTIKFGISI